jgi:protein SCO1
MNWRLASRLSVITLALLVVVIVAILGVRNSANSASSSGLQGTDLGSAPTQDFRLADQFGKQVSLSDFKGKPVVLTFLYTHCPDVCPLTAEKLHTVMQNLGSKAQNVAVLAVSLDPKGDTPASVLNFSQVHKMLNYWHYLMGTQNQLSPVWTHYGLSAQPVTPTNTSPGIVMHNTALYVIDKQGRERVLLPDDFTPDQLTTDLKVLLGE